MTRMPQHPCAAACPPAPQLLCGAAARPATKRPRCGQRTDAGRRLVLGASACQPWALSLATPLPQVQQRRQSIGSAKRPPAPVSIKANNRQQDDAPPPLAFCAHRKGAGGGGAGRGGGPGHLGKPHTTTGRSGEGFMFNAACLSQTRPGMKAPRLGLTSPFASHHCIQMHEMACTMHAPSK